MCLAVPMRIQSIEGNSAVVELSDVTRTVYLDVLDEEVRVGDYVIVHAGFVIHRIDVDEAEESLRLFEEIGLTVRSEEGGDAQ